MEVDYEGATQEPPFSNGFEWDCWSYKWCNRCLHEEACPLLDLVFCEELTPAEWLEEVPGGLEDRYTCTKFTPIGE